MRPDTFSAAADGVRHLSQLTELDINIDGHIAARVGDPRVGQNPPDRVGPSRRLPVDCIPMLLGQNQPVPHRAAGCGVHCTGDLRRRTYSTRTRRVNITLLPVPTRLGRWSVIGQLLIFCLWFFFQFIVIVWLTWDYVQFVYITNFQSYIKIIIEY